MADQARDGLTDDPKKQQDLPDTDDLIKAHIQYSEESRYRDKIMHNSYYFVLTGLVAFAGHLLSISSQNPLTQSFRLGFALFVGGVVAFFIAIIMKIYNTKRINAEHQRQVIEHVLDERYSKTGMYKIEKNEDLPTRNKDNPFAMQEMVIGQNEGGIDGFFIHTLKIDTASWLIIAFAAVTLFCGIVIMLNWHFVVLPTLI